MSPEGPLQGMSPETLSRGTSPETLSRDPSREISPETLSRETSPVGPLQRDQGNLLRGTLSRDLEGIYQNPGTDEGPGPLSFLPLIEQKYSCSLIPKLFCDGCHSVPTDIQCYNLFPYIVILILKSLSKHFVM